MRGFSALLVLAKLFAGMPAGSGRAHDHLRRRICRGDAGRAREARALLRQYRDATREENGNLRSEVVQRLGQKNHAALSAGPIENAASGSVVTHVDVSPLRKDHGVAAVKQLGDDSRKEDGNQRFEVAQQINRANHFTVVETWKSRRAFEAHTMAPHTRAFRDKLTPMGGALYDERLYPGI